MGLSIFQLINNFNKNFILQKVSRTIIIIKTVSKFCYSYFYVGKFLRCVRASRIPIETWKPFVRSFIFMTVSNTIGKVDEESNSKPNKKSDPCEKFK